MRVWALFTRCANQHGRYYCDCQIVIGPTNAYCRFMSLSHFHLILHSFHAGTGKSTIYKFLHRILSSVGEKLDANDVPYKRWALSDQTFEKLGELMFQNDCKALGLHNELTNFCQKWIYTAGIKVSLIHMNLPRSWNCSWRPNGQDTQVSLITYWILPQS